MSNTGPRTEAGKLTVSQNLNPTAWTKNPLAVEAIDIARRLRKTKHGMYASVPIICKAESCPYAENCELHKLGIAPFAEKCPIEIAAIEELYERYCSELKIDPNDTNSTIDLLMVKDIVDIDISLLRCDNKMAIDADFIIENVVGITENGDELRKRELHPVVEYKEKLRAAKGKTLQLLNSTRRDKIGSRITVELSPSQRASEMLKVNTDMIANDLSEEEEEKAYYRRKNGPAPGDVVIDVEPIGMDE